MSTPYLRQPLRGGEFLIATPYAERFQTKWFEAEGSGEGLEGGRGSVGVIATAIGTLVRRNYLRGGLPRHLIRDRYLWTGAERTRSFREFVVTHALYQAGLLVPEPIAACYWRSWLGYRAALLTRLIPNARGLHSRLAETSRPADLLIEVGEAIARLHARRVWHADLNATNILVDDAGKIWLIDFDRAELGADAQGRLAGNLERLLRSLRKRLPEAVMQRVERSWPDLIARYRRTLNALSSTV